MENKFRVWYEFEIDGQVHKGVAPSANWFLLSQAGVIMMH